MQNPIVFSALAAVVLLAATPALAQPYAEAKLLAPLSAPKTVSMNGLEWRCEADACVATSGGAPGSWGFLYACKKVVQAFGPLASYRDRSIIMTADDLARCNKAAPK